MPALAALASRPTGPTFAVPSSGADVRSTNRDAIADTLGAASQRAAKPGFVTPAEARRCQTLAAAFVAAKHGVRAGLEFQGRSAVGATLVSGYAGRVHAEAQAVRPEPMLEANVPLRQAVESYAKVFSGMTPGAAAQFHADEFKKICSAHALPDRNGLTALAAAYRLYKMARGA